MPVRQQVLDLVRRYPGIHVRRLERELRLSSRLASYHVEALEADGALQRVQEAGYARLFVAPGKPRWSRRDVEFICLMRRPAALRIALLLLSRGPLPNRGVAAELRLARPSATYHLGLMLEAGLVTARRAGRDRIYGLADEAYVRGALANFTPMPDDLEPFERVWDDLFAVPPG